MSITPIDVSIARVGARKVLEDCLDLRPGNRISLFFDEETREPATLLIEEAKDLGLRMTERFVPQKHQLKFTVSTGLCAECRAALHDVAAIITCLSANTATTPYRRELLRRGPTGTTKVGHIPGASLFVLASAINVDYSASVARCEELALALTVGEQATLKTYVMAPDGTPRAEHAMHIEIGGFRRMPVVSTGVIPPGTWGNLPGGETFIAPMEDVAHGEIAINGAMKGLVLNVGQALILRFEMGRLVHETRGDPSVVAAFNALLAQARASGDQDFDALAELGIGVNTEVKALTGNSLFDEKCAGTVHIALGDSSGFGGKYKSALHEDLISLAPTLTIDGKPILDHGVDAFREEDWFDDINTFPVDPRITPASRVMKSAERATTRGGVIRVNHQVGAGRVCSYRVGSAADSHPLCQIYLELKALNHIRFSELVKFAFLKHGLTEKQTAGAVSLLMRHRLASLI